jgi:hypothetical protein
VTDGVKDVLRRDFERDYGVVWLDVPVSKMRRRRAACKVSELDAFVNRLPEGDRILVTDADVYFRSNPMMAFTEMDGDDLGLTTRGYDHMFPINGGIFYIQVNQKMKDWIRWHRKEVFNPQWEVYRRIRKRYNHHHFGLDWSVGQDFLVANWEARDEVFALRGVRIGDVGPRYNYCPATDTMGERAYEMVRECLKEDEVVTVHLKSDLKSMIYDGTFPNTIRYPRGNLQWA